MSGLSEEKPKRKMVGYDNFVRSNPMSDRFEVIKFHSVEWWCGDATNTARRFTWGLGMQEVAKSDFSTGNKHFASSVVKSNDLTFVFSSPYSNGDDAEGGSNPMLSSFTQDKAHDFIRKHGLAVRAVGILVSDATAAYEKCVSQKPDGGVLAPTLMKDEATGKSYTVSEVKLVDDVVIRWISGDFDGPFLPNYANVDGPELTYGLKRLDHIVSNVPDLFNAVDWMNEMVGFHEFAEFTSEDVGTVDSGLNSMVMANNSETVLMPFNEPTFGTRRKSQIQTYLEHNNGAGIQHMALKTDDIFSTMREMKKRSKIGGFEFMPKPGDDYYKKIPGRIGADTLTAEQLADLQELGLLADKDDQGVLLQVFSKPVGDRPTAFMEIIQRIGCTKDEAGKVIEQKAGCGGFGKGNFTELFKSIETYEKSLE
jgi:4-hydroxyphenylpyruvate dioxygenase